MSRRRHANRYGQSDAGMRWLKEHDPDAVAPGYAERHGFIDNTVQSRIQRHEFSLRELELLEEIAERKASRHG